METKKRSSPKKPKSSWALVKGPLKPPQQKTVAVGAYPGEYDAKNVRQLLGTRQSNSSSLPPQILLFPARTLRIAYSGSSTAITPVTVGSLLNTFGSICTALNTTMYAVHSSVRVLSVSIWPSPSASGIGFADVFWSGASSVEPDEEKLRPVPTGVSSTAAAVFKPPARSLAGFWWNSGSSNTQLFSVQCSAGSVILVKAMLKQSNLYTPSAATIVAGTVGLMYYGYLDGATTHRFAPINLPTTF